jgi:rSAM/selenodomain-associated transferase 1
MIAVGIFAKPPLPGLVKTRLIPDIGADKAARVYRYCLEYTLAVVRQSGLDHQLFVTEVCDDPLFQNEEYSLQKGEDLGARMFHAFQELLKRGSDGAMIIGTDCLDLTSMHLQQAAGGLADHELVLLPAIDGGYALIGCRDIDPSLFDKVRWSTDQVYRQTLTNAEQLQYRVKSLESVRDIDRLQDLEHYPELLALIASS